MNDARHIDVDIMNALIDDAVPDAQRSAIMHHLAACAACRSELDELRAVARLTAGLPQLVPSRPFTLGLEYRRPAVNHRLLQTLPVIRSLAIAAVLVFVLISAFAVINTRQGSASSSNQAAPAQQNRGALLAPAGGRNEAPVSTQPAGSQSAAEVRATRTVTTQAAKPVTKPASQPAHSSNGNGRSLSGWWVASLVIGLGTALLLLAWFALDRGGTRRFGTLSRA